MTSDSSIRTFLERVRPFNFRLRWTVAAILCGMLLASASQAQVALGGLSGTITDSGGAAIAGANVTVTNSDTQGKREVTSDAMAPTEWMDFKLELTACK